MCLHANTRTVPVVGMMSNALPLPTLEKKLKAVLGPKPLPNFFVNVKIVIFDQSMSLYPDGNSTRTDE